MGAMTVLGNSLSDANRHDDALCVKEARLSMLRRLGAPEGDMLIVQGNLASTYAKLGRLDEALSMRRDVYSGRTKLNGEEHETTLLAASNWANCLNELKRYQEAKSLLRKQIPVARRVLGESDNVTLRVRWYYARAICNEPGATLDAVREVVTTFEDIERIARRVLGGENPLTSSIAEDLQDARAALCARETPPPPSPAGSV